MTIKNKHLMPSERYVMIRTIGDQLAIIKSMGQHEMFVTTDIMQEILEMLKEQEPQSVLTSSNIYTGLPITHCPKCGFALDRFLHGRQYQGEIKYCPMCGKAVKWE